MERPCPPALVPLVYAREDLRLLVFMTLFPPATAWAVVMGFTSWQWPEQAFHDFGRCPPQLAAILQAVSPPAYAWSIAVGAVAIGLALAGLGRPSRFRAAAIQGIGLLFTFAILCWAVAITSIEMCWTNDVWFTPLAWHGILGLLGSTGGWLLYRRLVDRGSWLPAHEFMQLYFLVTGLCLDTHHT